MESPLLHRCDVTAWVVTNFCHQPGTGSGHTVHVPPATSQQALLPSGFIPTESNEYQLTGNHFASLSVKAAPR